MTGQQLSRHWWRRLRCLFTGHRLGLGDNPAHLCVDCGKRLYDPEHQPDGVHTIPVPRGWSPEQAWEAIIRGDWMDDHEPQWANVLIRDGRFVELLDA